MGQLGSKHEKDIKIFSSVGSSGTFNTSVVVIFIAPIDRGVAAKVVVGAVTVALVVGTGCFALVVGTDKATSRQQTTGFVVSHASF